MGRALERLQHDALQAAPDERRAAEKSWRFSAEGEEPNIVADLPAAVAALQTRRDIVREGEGITTIGGLSLAGIGAAGAETLFPPRGETSFGPSTEQVALGALIGALSVAENRPVMVRDLPAPWEVEHPVLIDPVMWLIGTAYTAALSAPAELV